MQITQLMTTQCVITFQKSSLICNVINILRIKTYVFRMCSAVLFLLLVYYYYLIIIIQFYSCYSLLPYATKSAIL